MCSAHAEYGVEKESSPRRRQRSDPELSEGTTVNTACSDREERLWFLSQLLALELYNVTTAPFKHVAVGSSQPQRTDKPAKSSLAIRAFPILHTKKSEYRWFRGGGGEFSGPGAPRVTSFLSGFLFCRSWPHRLVLLTVPARLPISRCHMWTTSRAEDGKVLHSILF